jgi:hypothetical protein
MCWTKVGGIAIRRVCWLWGVPRSDLGASWLNSMQCHMYDNNFLGEKIVARRDLW